ncbi:amino acid adenylation domain-containing protein [Umezawaea sp. Da 62-37]|uniref:amino acid adenylation domain-containing protein n=1 Tax=Umezawaea sp. Da 62-37 TaxID=3075927 RepID=UPI0028F6E8EE|nr:amino acid adenylation domain-containing protein [Umezawaea sp. Da 62-37]WNV84707.1 amino acid adenylation domain-containing protein [Umezawaea sp. Da 62-37]
MSASTTSLASREYWLARADDVRAGDTAVAGLFDVCHGPADAVRPWDAGTASRLAAITGGDPVLGWTVVAAATAVALRRFGAHQAVTLLAGPPGVAPFPLVVRPRPGSTFRQWLGEVRVEVAEAMSHGESGLPRPALALVWDDLPDAADVALVCGATGIRARSATGVGHLLDAVATVLDEGLADPDRTLAELGVLDAAAAEVLAGFNRTGALDSSTPYRDLLLEQVRMRPGAVAVRDDTESFTYAELYERATAIAHRLRAEGVGRETPVALVAPRSAWFLVTAVGILFAGAAYVPVDPASPPARQADLVRRAGALIAGPEVPPFEGLVRFDPSELRDAVGDGPLQSAAPGDLAYIMFTSGSTGAPKGACVEHGAFLNLLATRVVDYGLRPGAPVPQTAPLTFDLSIWQLFAGLTSGATVCVVDDDDVRDPAVLLESAVRLGFACFALVPTYLVVLLDEIAGTPGLADRLRERLRLVVSTGEVLSPALAARWHAVVPGVPLLNAYGPAEVADDATGGPVNADEHRHTPVGRVLPNVTVHVLDTDLQPLPPGVVGEIHIGGRTVGRGYFGAPALTASAFLPDPFAAEPGSRLYRTGDRGYWRADGAVVLLGRADNQVKVRGRRVELGEVEHLLESSPDVARAVVELVDESTSARLVAFVSPAPGRQVDDDSLRGFAADRLPDYMVPHEVVVLDGLPRNNNGKVDRLALRGLAPRTGSEADYVAPRTELERVLCEVWSAHLPAADRIGVRHGFYALGGDSIVGIRIVQEAQRRGIALRPRHVIEKQTVEELAKVAMWIAQAPPPTGGTGDDSGPLVPAQLSFLARGVPNPNHWNHGVSFDLNRPFDLAAITAAVEVLARRHPALRTRFDLSGEPRQYAVPDAPPVTEFDLRGVDDVDAHAHRSATELHERLDLRTGPVSRFGVLRLSDVPDRVVAVVHHLLVDLFSWDLITEELAALLRDGDDRALPPPGPSYATWATMLADHVRADPSRLDVGYWLDRDWSTCAQVVEDGVAGTEGTVGEVRTVLDEDLSRAFAAAGAPGGPTVYERLLAALGTALRTWTGTDGDVLVHLGGHGREDVLDLDPTRVVGYFNSAYPFALPLSATADDIARQHRAIPNRGLDFEAARFLHPDPGVRERLAAVPTPRLLFNFWGTPTYLTAGDDVLGGVRIHGTGVDRDPAMPRLSALECFVVFAGPLLTVSWVHSRELMPVDRVRELADAFTDALGTTRTGSQS